MRWVAVFVLCALALFASAPAIAQTNIESVDVPVGLPTIPPPSPAPIATAAPAASATPQPLPSGLGISSSDWSFQDTPVSGWLDGLAGQVFGAFSTIMTKSIQLAQTLFYILAITEFGWTCGKWVISSTPLEEVVAEAYLKLIRVGLLYLLIGCTFTFPNGSPGWFPSIVGMIIGMAQTASGISIIGTYALNGSLNLTAGFSPGDVFTFFWNIAIFIIKTAFTQQSIGNLFVGTFTGATAVWMVTALLAITSGLGVMVLGIYTSFKYFATMFKAYVIASQAYLQGFLGSSVTASSGSGLFNAALNLGIELGALIVIMGVMKSFLALTLGAMNLGFLAAYTEAGKFGPAGAVVFGSIGSDGVRLVAILVLDTLVVLWAYLVKTIPEQAAAGITGRLDVRPEEMLAHMKAASTPLKTISAVGSAIAGALGVKMLGGSAKGDSPSIMDRAKGAATGAIQGALFAGPEGALGGALMGAMSAKSKKAADSKDEGTIGGRNTNDSAPDFGRQSSFANREFAPKDASAKKPTPNVKNTGAPADTPDERDLAAAGPDGDFSEGAADVAAGATIVDGSAAPIIRDAAGVEARGNGAPPSPAGDTPGEVPLPSPQRASKHMDGSVITLEKAPGRITDAGDEKAGAQGGPPPSPGGADHKAQSEKQGKKQGARGDAAQAGPDNNAMRDLASAMRENTEALRAHRFGGGAGGAGSGEEQRGSGGDIGASRRGDSRSSGGGTGNSRGTGRGGSDTARSADGSGGDTAGAPTDPIFGGGANAMNPLNVMMYRNLLGGSRAAAPRIQPEHPAATADLSALVK